MTENHFEGEMPLDVRDGPAATATNPVFSNIARPGPQRDERAIPEQAEDFMRWHRYEDAWKLLESLPQKDRMEPPAARLRLICAMATKRFETADELARHLGTGAEPDAQFASPVLQDLARIQFLSGSREYAKGLAVAAINAHPERRFEVIYDPTLKALF